MEPEDLPGDAAPDPRSQVGKWHPPAEHAQVVVVGAGPAGVAAAIAAARGGASVVLVDEHPVGGGMAGLDVPFLFGGRAGPAIRNKARMLERLLATNFDLETAFDLGVDVRLGTYCWGAFDERPGLRTLAAPVVGLADDDGSSMMSFDRLILATGARDLVLSFEGCDQPGVMGALGCLALLDRYEAMDGSRLLVLGSGELALDVAERALARGLDVAGLVEVRAEPQGDPARIAALGVSVLCGRVVRRAERGALGVTGAVLASTAGGDDVTVACDTIVLAIDRVPVVELADVVGAALAFDPARGGYVPARPDGTAAGATTGARVIAVGDCAGLTSSDAARAQGRAAAAAALCDLGLTSDEAASPPEPLDAGPDRLAYRMDWMRALLEVGSPEVLACQCEDVTRGQLLGVRPPRYLEAGPAFAPRDLVTLAGDGPIDQDQIKRLTRACMGACQARRCREQVAMMLAIGADVPLADVPLAGYRAPVRPLPLGVLADMEEREDMRAGWDVWFGIRTQWVPYDDVGTERETAFLGHNMHL